MKTMKKLVAALLVLSMVLALTGTAFAATKWKKWQPVKFSKNTVAYKTKDGKATKTIVKKGSTAWLACDQKDSKWVKLYLSQDLSVTGWFKASNLKTWKGIKILDADGLYVDTIWPCNVVYSNGGVGLSKVAVDENGKKLIYKDNTCKDHVKATATVWMHKEPSLSKNYGKALHKGDKAAYRHTFGVDTRGRIFWGIKYKGKCLWVSSAYSKVVK